MSRDDGHVSTVAEGFALARGLHWEDLADGRVHRLKRGKHYRGELQATKEAAKQAAEELGKAVRLVRDPLGKLHYVWVQFADGEIEAGQPCPCGNLSFDRVHKEFLHCTACGRALLVSGLEDGFEDLEDEDDELLDQEDDDEAPRRRAPRKKGVERLEDYADVRLTEVDRSPTKLLKRGVGRNRQGRPVLLLVRYRLDSSGRPLEDPEFPGEELYELMVLPADPFGEAIDVDRL